MRIAPVSGGLEKGMGRETGPEERRNPDVSLW